LGGSPGWGPDFSASLVRDTNPEIWEKAVDAKTKYPERHGYATVAEIMTDLNPLTGKLYLEALEMTRVAREAYVLLGGKYPHPETIIPGGVTTTLTTTTFSEFYLKIAQFFVVAWRRSTKRPVWRGCRRISTIAPRRC
jgi:hydrogenase large subunit